MTIDARGLRDGHWYWVVSRGEIVALKCVRFAQDRVEWHCPGVAESYVGADVVLGYLGEGPHGMTPTTEAAATPTLASPAPALFLAGTLRPALIRAAVVLALPMAGPEAETQLLATALQETGLRTRLQAEGGPGRSFFQLERALDLVHAHPQGGPLLSDLVRDRYGTGLTVPVDLLLASLADPLSDGLACQIARLVLWLDRASLPALGSSEAAWQCYLRTWRPGVPRPLDWPVSYGAALAAVRGVEGHVRSAVGGDPGRPGRG